MRAFYATVDLGDGKPHSVLLYRVLEWYPILDMTRADLELLSKMNIALEAHAQFHGSNCETRGISDQRKSPRTL